MPKALTVIMADTFRTSIAVQCENEWVPFRRRTVHIKLTEEQLAQLVPREVGSDRGKPAYEEIVGCWLEDA